MFTEIELLHFETYINVDRYQKITITEFNIN